MIVALPVAVLSLQLASVPTQICKTHQPFTRSILLSSRTNLSIFNQSSSEVDTRLCQKKLNFMRLFLDSARVEMFSAGQASYRWSLHHERS